MGSINGLVDITATSISNSGQFYLGNNLDPGTAGQVIVSAGTQLPAEWGTNAATLPNALTMGTNVTLASGNPSFDGGIADTINATDNQLTLVGTTPITIASVGLINTIGIDYDGVTLDLDGSDLAVLKVPNDLTINGTVYNGSVPRTITTTDTTYTGTQPIAITVGNDIQLQYDNDTIILDGGDIAVAKVPNDLTINGTVYNGSIARTITISGATYTGTIPISISGANAIGVNYDGDTIDLDGADLAVMKVPNTLTFTGYDTGTFDGSSALSINLVDTDTTYTAGNGIQISGSNIIQTKTDNQTIRDSGGGSGNNLEVMKVPNDLTINGTVYNGSVARTITTTDTTYTAGTNIGIDGSNKISLKTGITGMLGVTFLSDPSPITALIGNSYPGNQTPVFYMDLTSTTNVLPSSPSPFLSTKIQETYLIKTITTSYTEYSSNFRTSFVAQSSNVMVEFRAVMRCDNRIMYGGLYDYNAGSFWTTPQTQVRFNFNDETDQDYSVYSWWISGLTAGTTYYISPYFRSSSNYSYIYAGNTGIAERFPPGIFRVIDGGDNVSAY